MGKGAGKRLPQPDGENGELSCTRGAARNDGGWKLGTPGRIYRVIIVILVIDYPRTISAAPWLCTPAGTVSIYRIM